MQQAETDVSSPVEQGAAEAEEVVIADEATTSEAETEETEEEHQPSRLERRFSELTTARDREKARAEQYETEAQKLRDQLAQYQAQSQMGQHQAAKPTLSDFDSIDEYEQAIQQWTAHGVQVQYAAQQQAQQEAARQQTLMQTRATGAQKYPDFDQVVNNPTIPSLSQVAPAAFEALMESNASADVAYALAKDPAKVFALAQKSPAAQIREILKLESQLTANPSPQSPQTDPVTPVHGGSGPVVKDPERMSTKEWMQWRNAQIAKRRG